MGLGVIAADAAERGRRMVSVRSDAARRWAQHARRVEEISEGAVREGVGLYEK